MSFSIWIYVFGFSRCDGLINSFWLFLVMKLQNITQQFVYSSFCLPHLALQTENIVQKITQLKWQKNQNEVTKICNEPSNSEWVRKGLISICYRNMWMFPKNTAITFTFKCSVEQARIKLHSINPCLKNCS